MISYLFLNSLLVYYQLAKLLDKIIIVPFFTLLLCVSASEAEIKIGSGREYDDLYYLDDGTLHFGLATISPSNTHYNGIIG